MTDTKPEPGTQITPYDSVMSTLYNEHTTKLAEEMLMGAYTGQQFMAQCITTLTTREDLQKFIWEFGPSHLLNAFMNCARMGLVPGAGDLVYLIPRRGKNPVINAQPSWRGAKALMERNPNVLAIVVSLVHRLDSYSVSNGHIIHTYNPFDNSRVFRHPEEIQKGDLHDLIGGYCKVILLNGAELYHFMSESDIEKRRMCSDQPYKTKWGSASPWAQWYQEMCMKTVVLAAHSRRIIPYDPAHVAHLDWATKLDNAAMGNVPDPDRHNTAFAIENQRDPVATSMAAARAAMAGNSVRGTTEDESENEVKGA